MESIGAVSKPNSKKARSHLANYQDIISAPQGEDADDNMATQNPEYDDKDEEDALFLGVNKVGDIL